MIDDVRNFLFGPPGSGGFDLVSLNIQRGRDHGLPSYKAVREALGLASVSSFADITSDVERQNALAAVYNNDVNQVDLWVGGLAEDHAEGALLGPTFRAIIADQFTRLRDGSSFWHENLDWSAYGLAADPLLHENGSTLSDVKLSDIIRWNTEISNIQDNVFLVPTLELAQTISSPTAQAGDTLTYQIVLTTTGSTTNVSLIDHLPAGLTYVADSVTGGATFAEGQIRYERPVLADNPHIISYQATVDGNLADGTILYSAALATWQGTPLEDAVTVVIEALTVEHTLVLLYVNGDNDLSEHTIDLANKAEQAAGNPDATVLLLLDGSDDEGAYLYRLQEDDDPGCPNYINPTCDERYVMGQNLWQWHENIATSSSL